MVVQTQSTSTPKSNKISARRSIHVSDGGADSGRNRWEGGGSNVSTIAGPETWSAILRNRETNSRCPRWTPSKFPIVIAPPFASGGIISKPTTIKPIKSCSIRSNERSLSLHQISKVNSSLKSQSNKPSLAVIR